VKKPSTLMVLKLSTEKCQPCGPNGGGGTGQPAIHMSNQSSNQGSSKGCGAMVAGDR